MRPLCRIQRGGYRITPISVADVSENVSEWLLEQAQSHGLATLLAHADDGVIWGRITSGTLQTSHQVFGDPPSPQLRIETLQQARLFSEEAELLVWRTINGWRARLAEHMPDEGECYDQTQLLWGNRHVNARQGFTLVEEGRQGLRHAPPVLVPQSAFADERHPLRLHVRHYVATDPQTSVVDVVFSQLVKVDFEIRDTEREVLS